MEEVEVTICGRYKLGRQLHSNQNFAFFDGYNLNSRQRVFIKAELKAQKYHHLLDECKILQGIQGGPGVPSLYWCGQDQDYNFLVMERLADCHLQALLKKQKNHFSLKSVIQIGLQLLQSIHYLHSKGLVFNNINPVHIVPGTQNKSHKLHQVDYSLVTSFRNSTTGEHIPLSKKKPFHLNLGFSSLNIDKGFPPSRRDDVQSWLYLLVFLLQGSLPWLNNAPTDSIQIAVKIEVTQAEGPHQNYTFLSGAPRQFKLIFRYIRSLEFEERPDYEYLRDSLYKLASKEGILLDSIFDWDLSADWSVAPDYPSVCGLNITMSDSQKQLIEQQYQLFLMEELQSNNISHLLSQTVDCPSPPESPPPGDAKQRCLLF